MTDTPNNVVSAQPTTDLCSVPCPFVIVAGEAEIVSLGGVANHMRFAAFTGSPVLKHSAALSLPGARDIPVHPGDSAIFVSDTAGNWRCFSYELADGGDYVVATPAPAPVRDTARRAWRMYQEALQAIDDATPTPDEYPILAASYSLDVNSTADKWAASASQVIAAEVAWAKQEAEAIKSGS